MHEELIERLRKVESSDGEPSDHTTCWYRNPDGPEAADTIASLESRVKGLKRDRDYYAGLYAKRCGALLAAEAQVKALEKEAVENTRELDECIEHKEQLHARVTELESLLTPEILAALNPLSGEGGPQP